MDDHVAPAAEALTNHAVFTRTDDVIVVDTSPFEVTVHLESSQAGVAYSVVIEMPSLDAVTEESVAAVIEDGWSETLERRLADAPQATGELTDASYTFEREEDAVRATFTFEGPLDTAPAEAIKALATFAEGTYLQGVVPGYTYGPPVDGMLERASRQAEDVAGS